MSDDAPPSLASPGTLVLLGAGASVGAGFPTSMELHSRLLNRLDPLYGNLARLVFPNEEAVDPERLFRVMEFLQTVESPPGTSTLGNEARDVAALVKNWHQDIVEYLNTRRHAVQGSPLQRAIDQLWRELVAIFSLSESPIQEKFAYLAHLASQLRGQTVVTLNYDDALEHIAGQAMTFRIISSPYPEAVEDDNPLTRPLRLVKLHGSLDWSRDDITGDIFQLPPMASFRNSHEPWEGHTPGIIFGAGNKLRPDGPYLALYQEFLVALSKARQVIVIGYSFRDSHVNEALRRWVIEQAADDSLLRLGCLERTLPPEVERWVHGRRLDVEVISGPAEDTMTELLAPRPRLMGRS